MATTEFQVPNQGEHGDLPDNEMPTTALRVCQNLLRNEKGRLATRPGFKRLSTTNPTDRVMGIGHFRTAATLDMLVAGTLTKLWAFNNATSIWENKTGATALTGGITDHIRFVVMSIAGVYNVIAMNGVNTMQIWDGGAGNFIDVVGGPIGIAGALCANRLLVLVSPNQVSVSEFNNPNSWPAGSGYTILLIDGGDLMIGMEQMTRTSVAAIGEESQWVLRAQTGTNPIRAERISSFPGPLSAAALVRAGSVVFWLAVDYNVYRFDGVNCQPVGDAMRAWVKASISVGNRGMTHGVYNDDLWKIFWFFAASGDLGPNLGIYIDVRTGEMGRLKYSDIITASGRVRVSTTVTWNDLAAFTWDNIVQTYPAWDSFGDPASERRSALGALTGDVHIQSFGDGSDNGKPIEAVMELPLKAYAGWPLNIVPQTFETFFKKTPVSTTVETAVGSTNTLMDEPVYQNLLPFDLNTDQRNDVDLTPVTQKRYVTLRHKIVAPRGGVEWQGGLMTFETEEIEAGPTGV